MKKVRLALAVAVLGLAVLHIYGQESNEPRII
jgi:hypothetical protein